MTEQEWVERNSPFEMMRLLHPMGSRKCDLAACASWRLLAHLLDSGSRDAIELLEQLAETSNDNIANDREYAAMQIDQKLCEKVWDERGNLQPNWDTATASIAAMTLHSNAVRHLNHDAFSSAEGEAERAAEKVQRDGIDIAKAWTEALCSFCSVLRDIFGNPFRPVAIDPRWLTSTVADFAQAIYEEPAYDRMPILADALMDAGCDSETVIAHCCGNGLHVRGCWVVDLLLGNE